MEGEKPNSDLIDWNILVSVITHQATDGEIEAWRKWINESQENQKIYNELKQVWNISIKAKDYELLDVEKAKQNVKEQLISKGEFFKSAKKEKPKGGVYYLNKKSKMILKLAASLLLLICVTYFINKNNADEGKLEVYKGGEYIERTTQRGEKLTIRLMDGSSVKLNVESKIIFPKHFSDSSREIFLEGEAFFEVVKDRNRPFIVSTPYLNTRVLGTSFNVNTKQGNNNVQVALVSGKVEVTPKHPNKGNKPIVLKPDEMVEFNKEQEQFLKSKFDYTAIIGWKDDILTFNNADFETIKTKIEKWYGVTIIMKYNGKMEKGFTASYKNKSLETVLQGVCFSFGFQYEYKENIVIIY
ncbi:FecR family protein [Flexithrix dorotheae]|uniref:FecR family protein n=1 Tax=Flexithrix dorotheae TaxID=70993 RepID=UPI000381289D|nr:FecR family protein [Flexithrix dorotheae]